MIHAVKCLPEYFAQLDKGDKTFEVRKNDRPYMVGDLLAVNEFVPFDYNFSSEKEYQRFMDRGHTDDAGWYSDRFLIFRIIYILDNPDFCKDGTVILGLKKRLLEA